MNVRREADPSGEVEHDTRAGRSRHSSWEEIVGSVPNQLTASRLLAIPVLWGLALWGPVRWLGVGVAAAALTDVLDGFLARRLGRTTALGSRLDSLADHLLSASLLAWLWLHHREFFREQLVPLLIWGGAALAVLAVSWVRFRRLGDLHLYSAKAAGTLGYLFGIHALITGSYSGPLFYLAFSVAMLAAAETLYALLTRSRVDEHLGSVLRAGTRPTRGPSRAGNR